MGEGGICPRDNRADITPGRYTKSDHLFHSYVEPLEQGIDVLVILPGP